MANSDIGGWGMTFPAANGVTGAAALNAATIDADGEKVAFLLRCPKDGTLNRVGFLVTTVTQAPTNGLTVSFQDLDASGDPDGTQDELRNVPVADISANTWVETGLLTDDGTDTGVKRTVSQGDTLAVVIEFASFAASDSIAIGRTSTSIFIGNNIFFPVSSHFTSSWSKSTGSIGPLIVALQYSDSVWEPITFTHPASAALTTQFSSASTPDVYGNKFVAPGPLTVNGFVADIFVQSNASAMKFYLYDDADTALATATVADPDIFLATNARGAVYVPFDAVADEVTLTNGSTYRVVLEATSTGGLIVQGYSFPSGYGSAMPSGANCVGTTRKDSGSWTDTATNQYAIGLQISGIDDGVSTGGSTVIFHRNYD